jgi:spermidine synthase
MEWSTHCNTEVVRWVLREHGATLAGPSPRDLVDEVDPDVLRTRMREEARDFLPGMLTWIGLDSPWAQRYAVATLCRILYTLDTGQVASKRAALLWARDALEPQWRSLISEALEGRSLGWNHSDPIRPGSVQAIQAFGDDARERASAGGQEALGSAAVVVERVVTPRGELALRRAGMHYEIIHNGVFLMDTRNGASERLLVRAALDACGRPRVRILIGGLGVGFSLDEALRHPAVTEVAVVEVEEAIIRWHAAHFGAHAHTALQDPRTRVVNADLTAWLVDGADRFDAICLDIDNGPDWTVTAGNAVLYTEEGLSLLRRRLVPGGVLAVWSAMAAPAFEAALRQHFISVQVHVVEVPRGDPDHVYVARARYRDEQPS